MSTSMELTLMRYLIGIMNSDNPEIVIPKSCKKRKDWTETSSNYPNLPGIKTQLTSQLGTSQKPESQAVIPLLCRATLQALDNRRTCEIRQCL